MYFFRKTLQRLNSSRNVKCLLAAAIIALGWSAIAAAQTITEFPIPTASSSPVKITAGPDGALWFTERTGNKIGRITTNGTITEFSIPTGAGLNGIAVGSDGNLWFIEGGKIGRITTAGTITEFPVPTICGGAVWITAGPDGALWFTETLGQLPCVNGSDGGANIGRITTTGAVTIYPIPGGAITIVPGGIAAGSDGALWFTEIFTNKIGRITTAGVITEYPVPTANSQPDGITAGPDGALWFTENTGGKIGRITTAGVFTEFALPTDGSGPFEDITTGPDGALWFTEGGGNKIGRITTTGTITEYNIPTACSQPFGITAGPDGALWFTEFNGNKIGRITTTGSPSPLKPTASHDFNGDCKSDILWRNGTTVAGWLMNSNAVAQQTGISGVPTDWHIVGQRDFNGDGKTDILWYNSTSGDVSVWLMNGLSVPSSVAVGRVDPGLGWHIAGVSDFTGDGKADILWQHNSSGALAIWFLIDGAFQSSGNVGTVTGWTIRGTSANGHILWQHDASGTVAIWDMTGATVSNTHNVGTVAPASGWTIVGAGDFDGDGHGDLLWKHSPSGAVSIWFLVNGAVTSTGNVGTVDPASGWFIDLTGDFDGDGKSDIVWTHSSGVRSLWRMNGATVLQSLPLGTVTPDWIIQSMAAE